MGTHKKVRKQFLLDPETLASARLALNARTDTETVERALKMAIANGRMAEAHRTFFELALQSDEPFEDVYEQLGERRG
jgi:hypothetical protein